MPEVIEKIYEHIVDKLGVEQWRLTWETSFADDLGVDSLDVFELIAAIEKDFDITIPDEDAEKLKTVGALQNYVTKLVNAHAPVKNYAHESQTHG